MNLRNLLPLVLNAVDSPNTRRVYRGQLEAFFDWCGPRQFSRATVQEYVRSMRKDKGPSSCNLALAAIRKLATEAADHGTITREEARAVLTIKNVKQRGHKTGQWLTMEDSAKLIRSCDLNTTRGMRNRVMLGLLLECGLRREEAAEITVDQIQTRERRAVIADLVSKGNRTRTVPVPQQTVERIKQWKKMARIKTGPLLRPVNKADRIDTTYGDDSGMSSAAIYKQVRTLASEVLGVDLRPHDLRRTFGRLARQGGAELDQIQQTFGHQNIRTTQDYIGDNQTLSDGGAPCDMVDLEKPVKGRKR